MLDNKNIFLSSRCWIWKGKSHLVKILRFQLGLGFVAAVITFSESRISNNPSVDLVFRVRHGLQGGCCQCLLHPQVRSLLCTAPQWWSSNVFAPFLARKCYEFVIEKSLFF